LASNGKFQTVWNRDNVFCAQKDTKFYSFGSETANLKGKAAQYVNEYNKVSPNKKSVEKLLATPGFITAIYNFSENLLRPLTGTIEQATAYITQISQHTESVKNEVQIIRKNAQATIDPIVKNNAATGFFRTGNYDAALSDAVLALLALDKDLISYVNDTQKQGQQVNLFRLQKMIFDRATNHFIVGRCYQKRPQPDLLSAHRHFVLARQFHRDFLFPDQTPMDDWKKSLAKYEGAIQEVLGSLGLT
jgi:hypothetical protein